MGILEAIGVVGQMPGDAAKQPLEQSEVTLLGVAGCDPAAAAFQIIGYTRLALVRDVGFGKEGLPVAPDPSSGQEGRPLC